jgi:hypothetical protein
MGHCRLFFTLRWVMSCQRYCRCQGITLSFFLLRNNGAVTRDEMAHLRVSLRICQEGFEDGQMWEAGVLLKQSRNVRDCCLPYCSVRLCNMSDW